jgi:3-hydroxyacyl-CoA dehydrogenase / enoyl-CoA hydratase / 3-hydroxybutyryl-CoA epimerase
MKHITLNRKNVLVTELIFNQENLPVNILNDEMMSELDTALNEIKTDKKIKVLIIKSAKESCFIAGADIHEIESFQSEKDAYKKVVQGQEVLTKIAHLNCTTIAIIDGACLGGGYELALCCDFRIATNSTKTIIGLPEVNLGVMPGFGGTVRLKKLVGIQKALELILAGKLIKGEKAQHLKMVDITVPHGYLEFRVESFVDDILKSCTKQYFDKRYKKTILDKYFPNIIFKFARKELLKKTKGFYKAPEKVIDVFEQTQTMRFDEALRIEAFEFSKLAVSECSKNLIELFFSSEAQKKLSAKSAIDIQFASVVGGGVMGSGITWLLSNQNLNVRASLRKNISISQMIARVTKIYRARVKRKRLTNRELRQKIAKISYTTSLVGFNKSDIIIEAIVEDVESKQKLYTQLEATVTCDTIIASNTSSLSVNELSSKMKNPERFVGMHFFNPVHLMPLVEIIPTKLTNEKTLHTVIKLVKDAGKIPVVVEDCSGFLVNRVLLSYMNESFRIFEQGCDFEFIDKVIKEFGMPMGPFELLDEVGFDVGLKVSKILEHAYGKRAHISPLLTSLVEEKKLLGKKTGLGFYHHSKKSKKLEPNMDIKKMVDVDINFTEEEIIDRSMLIMVNEAAYCLQDNIVKSANELDIAMIMGTGFAPFRGGVLKYADSYGIHNVVLELKRLSKVYGERFEPCDYLLELDEHNKNFYNKN